MTLRSLQPINHAVVLFGLLNAWISWLPAQAVKDSAGVLVVTSSRSSLSASQVQRVSTTPSITIGSSGDTLYEFSKLAGAVRLSDGRILVADGGTSQLRIFNARGLLVKVVGRKGAGPGDFPSLTTLAILPGDTIAAGDLTTRISYFNGNGRFLGLASPLTPPIAMPDGDRLTIGILGGGVRAIASSARFRMRAPGVRWIDSFHLAIVDRANSVVRQLGDFPSYVVEMSQDGPIKPNFAPGAAFAVTKRTFFVGFGNRYSIRAYGANGQLLRIINRQWSPTPITKSMIESYVAASVKRLKPRTDVDKARDAIRNAPRFDVLPAFAQMLGDRLGRLWVREARMEDAPEFKGIPAGATLWSVFDVDGRWLEDVQLPSRFIPTDVGKDYVLGIAYGSDDVETVVMYKLDT